MTAAKWAWLRAVYLATTYRVRLPQGGWAGIRIGAPLPAPLRRVLPQPDANWGVITAWNPRSQRLDTAVNRARQRRLLADIRHDAPAAQIRAALGVGPAPAGTATHWCEPSVFVVTAGATALDDWMHAFDQLAIVRGTGGSPATLCWNAALCAVTPEASTPPRHGQAGSGQ